MIGTTLPAREVPLGGLRGLSVQRTLPHRQLPTIGAWCFVDHIGPTSAPMNVQPHPHIGLQTVTWPIEGRIRHRDSLGSDVVLRPGELNLMTSGTAISHSELGVGAEPLHAVQLWVALPEARRHGVAEFEHLADPPVTGGPGWQATVFMGSLADVTSPAQVHSPLVGAQIALDGAVDLAVNPAFEHGILAVDAPLFVDGVDVAHRDLRYVPPGASSIRLAGQGTVMLIGGTPFAEELVMWWNFIGRTHDDIVEAREAWEAEPVGGRFGRVHGHGELFVPAPPLPGVRLQPRRRR